MAIGQLRHQFGLTYQEILHEHSSTHSSRDPLIVISPIGQLLSCFGGGDSNLQYGIVEIEMGTRVEFCVLSFFDPLFWKRARRLAFEEEEEKERERDSWPSSSPTALRGAIRRSDGRRGKKVFVRTKKGGERGENFPVWASFLFPFLTGIRRDADRGTEDFLLRDIL